MSCVFCDIATHRAEAVRLFENDHLMAFLDRGAIRRGHTQIITKEHVPYFDDLSGADAARILDLGQRLARRLKAVYGVPRVAFLFTGGDIAHVHAHVVPLHDMTDITSARYLVGSPSVEWSSEHLRQDRVALEAAKAEIAFGPACL
jgi:histidine triad (HIT) family protein